MPTLSDRRSLAAELREDLRPDRLALGVMGGLVVGVVVVIVAISFGALIFSGELADFTSRGIGFGLLSAAVLGTLAALGSSFRGMVATPQDSPAAIMALIVASIAAGMPVTAPREEVFATVVAAVSLTSILTGVFFFALGSFKLGGLVRFIPYPVIGGFLAGTGWLLVKGSFGVMCDVPLGFRQLGVLMEWELAKRWLPGLIFGLLLFALLRRFRHFLILPGMLLASIAMFYLLLLASGTPVSVARDQGFFLGPFPGGGLWEPPSAAALAAVDWGLILGQAGSLTAILVVGVVALLLNASGLELAVERDVDLDRELRTAGFANALVGLGGGIQGFQTLSLSALGHRLCADSRVVGLVSAGLCAATLALGGSVLSFFPKPALGGLLLFLGLAFLVEWVYDAAFKLPRSDYFVVLLILVVIGTVGYLESVGVGIVIAVVLFVVNYSRIDVVKHSLSGASHSSKVDRPRQHRRLLEREGDQQLILELQGFLFFGTADNLFQQVRRRTADAELAPLRFAVLDFRQVSGLDSSAVLSFVKMKQLAESQELTLVLADCSPEIREQLEKGGLVDGERLRSFPELDRAVEWCEDQILLTEGVELEGSERPLREQLVDALPALDPTRMMQYFERQEVEAGHYLMRQGDPPDDLFFVESGQVTAQMELEDGSAVRLLTMGAGAVVGEMELCLAQARSASVITERPSVVYRLTAATLERMEEENAEVAAAFFKFVSRLMAERLVLNNRALRALLR
ncbi:MAG: SLC26A/SulP transporter family protein [bacterium]|nr:SLC26A/SulP transporter family protein [bacterium]